MTERATKIELVALAVYNLGGHLHPVDMEDVAVEVDRLVPGEFRWRKRADQIDLVRVRSRLYDAIRRKNPLLAGSETEGWTLTPTGLSWVRGEGERFLVEAHVPIRREERHGSLREDARWRRERERVLHTNAWIKWQGGARAIIERDAAEVFRIDAYAVGRTRDLKVARVRELFTDDPELDTFLTAAAAVVAGKEQGEEK